MKSADDAMQMTMFGVQVCITVASAKITVHLEETKVLPWLKDMQEVLRKYMRKRKSGERVLAKIWSNADVEDVIPPPLIIRPYLDGLKLCTGCGEKRFCSKACQLSAWPTHKAFCKRKAAQKKADSSD